MTDESVLISIAMFYPLMMSILWQEVCPSEGHNSPAVRGMQAQTSREQTGRNSDLQPFKEAAGEVDSEKTVTAPRAVVVLGLKLLWFTHPGFPATQKGPVPTSPPPGFPFFPESGSLLTRLLKMDCLGPSVRGPSSFLAHRRLEQECHCKLGTVWATDLRLKISLSYGNSFKPVGDTELDPVLISSKQANQ